MKRALVAVLVILGGQALATDPTGRYKAAVTKLQALHAAYPDITQIFSIGDNADGVAIQAIRVSLTPSVSDDSKIANLVVATHHGNELRAADFTLSFLEQLLQKYRTSELFRTELAETEWDIVPVLNVSGYNAGRREEHGMDSNRDYPGPCVTGPGGQVKSIALIMNYMASRTFVGSLTVHGYLGALTYPWGVSTDNTHTPDHNAFEQITRNAAAFNGYRYGTSTDVVYPADGTFEDYAYWRHGMWSLLLELKNGSATDIADTSNAIFSYFSQLDSAPSSQHALASGCSRAGGLDLHNE